jgi:hypothetical protein
LLCIWTGWKSQGAATPGIDPAEAEVVEETAGPVPSWSLRLLWVALAACPSMLLLSLTSHMTMDLAPMPFLWILPLTIYLLSFILCFDASKWYRRKTFLILLPIALGVTAWLIGKGPGDLPNVLVPITVLSLAFFVCCMVCHGELARLKPHPRHLTGFYLMLAVGGAIGGVFVALVAPAVFNAYYELPLSVGLCGGLALVVLFREKDWVFRRDTTGLPVLIVCLLAALLFSYLGLFMRNMVRGTLFAGRNFYGGLQVRQHGKYYDWDGYRSLAHGSTNHGEQYTHPARHKMPTTYYCPDSGVGRSLGAGVAGTQQRVAIIGLGAGTLAAYARPGDFYRFYEINPMVPTIANTYFTYLKYADSQVDIRMGDARLTLERQEPQNYDLIAVDAFSSDSIPVHLLTLEALRLYFKHLTSQGVLAVHISNRYINLEPVLERGSFAMGKTTRVYKAGPKADRSCQASIWVLMASNPATFEREELKNGVPPAPAPWLHPWTDDYSNIYRVLRVRSH